MANLLDHRLLALHLFWLSDAGLTEFCAADPNSCDKAQSQGLIDVEAEITAVRAEVSKLVQVQVQVQAAQAAQAIPAGDRRVKAPKKISVKRTNKVAVKRAVKVDAVVN